MQGDIFLSLELFNARHFKPIKVIEIVFVEIVFQGMIAMCVCVCVWAWVWVSWPAGWGE
jgi:hypothetical protein